MSIVEFKIIHPIITTCVDVTQLPAYDITASNNITISINSIVNNTTVDIPSIEIKNTSRFDILNIMLNGSVRGNIALKLSESSSTSIYYESGDISGNIQITSGSKITFNTNVLFFLNGCILDENKNSLCYYTMNSDGSSVWEPVDPNSFFINKTKQFQVYDSTTMKYTFCPTYSEAMVLIKTLSTQTNVPSINTSI